MEISILTTSWGLSLNNKLVFIAWLGFNHREQYYDIYIKNSIAFICGGRLMVKKNELLQSSFEYTAKVFQE